jgi:uncharacterized protein YeaO (DUF488 family)
MEIAMRNISLKRVYETPDAGDGFRILIDRLWPRGLTKEKAHVDLWLKDIAPSDALRKRFHGKPEDWDAFRAAYAKELESATAQAAVKELVAQKRRGRVTLLYASRDDERNNAVALKAWLEQQKS